MGQFLGGYIFIARQFASLLESLIQSKSHNELLFLAFGGRQEVSGYAMSPPQLARNTPVLNLLQPIAIDGDVLCRIKLDLSFKYRGQGDVGKVLHREEPLLAEARLYSGVLVTLRVAHLIVVILHLLHQVGLLQINGNLPTHLHAVHTHVEPCSFGERTVRIENVDGLEVVCFTQGIVVHVVSRGHLQTARTELNIHVAVFYDRDNATHQRHHHFVAAQPLVLGVLGVNTHGGIAHDGFGTCGSYNGVVTSVLVAV